MSVRRAAKRARQAIAETSAIEAATSVRGVLSAADVILRRRGQAGVGMRRDAKGENGAGLGLCGACRNACPADGSDGGGARVVCQGCRQGAFGGAAAAAALCRRARSAAVAHVWV